MSICRLHQKISLMSQILGPQVLVTVTFTGGGHLKSHDIYTEFGVKSIRVKHNISGFLTD